MRQPVVRDARAQHAAWDLLRLEHRHGVAEVRQVARAGQAGRAGADDRHSFLVDDRRRLHRPRRADRVGHEALEAGDRDRLVHAASGAGRLAEVGADAAAHAAEGIGLARDTVGVLEAPGRHQRHVPLCAGVHGARALAGAPALLLDGERARHGVGELPVDRLAVAHPEVEVVRIGHGTHRHALAAADAGLAHVARLVAQGDPEFAGRSADLVDLGQGVDVDAVLKGGVGEARRQRAHRAVLGREGLAEASHVAAE